MSSVLLESASCEICGSSQASVLYTKKDKLGIGKDPFTVVRCNNCSFSYLSPRPLASEIGQYYPDHYQWKESRDNVAPGLFSKLEKCYRYHQLKTEITKMKKKVWKFPAKVLDVGCGTGDRLMLLRSSGCEVFGVETSQQARYAVEHFKIPVFQGDLVDAGYEAGSFDIITLYNVLEHVHNPRALLKEICRLLKPGGVLVVQVPNVDSFQSKIFGSRWADIDLPRHLAFFNSKTLNQLVRDCGLQIQAIDYRNSFLHPPTMVISFFPSLDPQLIWADDAKSKNAILKRLAWGLTTLVCAPFAYLEGLMGRGALMTAYVSKDTCKELSC